MMVNIRRFFEPNKANRHSELVRLTKGETLLDFVELNGVETPSPGHRAYAL